MATLTDSGWPRPVIGNWPIPWVTPAEDLKQVDPDRMSEVVERGLCQVCGDPAEKDEPIYVLVNLENGPAPEDLSAKTVQAMDNAVMHERCMRLAIARCPCLRRLRAADKLVLYRAPWRRVLIYSCSEPFLGVDGEHVERIPLP